MAETKTGAKKVAKIDLTGKKPLFSWQTHEFISYKRDKRWTALIILAAIILAVILATQKQWTGVALVVVAVVVFLAMSNTKPKNIGCAIFDEGIVVDEKVFSYDQFKSFWFIGSELPKIRFQMVGRFADQISMPLGDIDHDQVRLFLSKKLPEDEPRGEDLNDVINRLFRI